MSKIDERKNCYETEFGVNLYVKNLDDTIDEERLRFEFMRYGSITSAKVMLDELGRSKGFGFVYYISPFDAIHAIAELNGRVVGSKRLYVSLAQHKDERMAQLALHYFPNMCGMPMQHPLGQQYPMPNVAGGFFVPAMAPGQRFIAPQVAAVNAMLSGKMAAFAAAKIKMRAGGSGDVSQRPPDCIFTANIWNSPAQQLQAPPLVQQLQAPPLVQQLQAPPPVLQQQAPPRVHPMYQEDQTKILTSHLVHAKPHVQKNMLSQRLYPKVERMHPYLAREITELLLAIDNSYILEMLEDNDILKAKVEEAAAILEHI